MALDLGKLNEEQRQAVTFGDGPLLIVAGAGTGKTTVITQRIINLIENGKARPEEILALTFTEKAAGEMEERVDGLLDCGYVDLWISTFHAFCERILKDHSLDIGLPADFKLLDQTSAWLLLRQNLEKFNLSYYRPLGNPTKFISALLSHFSHCKDQEVYPEDYLIYADKLKTNLTDLTEDQEAERIKEVAGAYHVYQKMLLENKALDFGDLINYCLKLFKSRPKILDYYRDKFKYILVDEFQDTNWSQYELIKLLAAPKNNLTVCADDDQAIYRWRGASFGNIIQFKNDFRNVFQISLVKNYRSSQEILDLAYKFIKANDPDRLECVSKLNKKLISCHGEKGTIEHIHEKDLDREVLKTIEKITEILKNDKNASFNDFAILVRANDTAGPFIRGLERAGLPYQFLASRGLYSKPLILDIISYFKLLDNYHESLAMLRVLNLPFLNISSEDIMLISRYSHTKGKSMYEAMNEILLIKGVSENAKNKISFVLSLIKKHSELAREHMVTEVLIAFLDDSGYLKYIVDSEKKEDIDLLNQFHKRIKKFEEEAIDHRLGIFMDELNLELESGEEGKLEFDPEQGPDMIKVMTIHGSKGLEFKYVFIVNMVDRRFPTTERKDPIELPDDLIKDIRPTGDVHLQEERRLCYVAMTRAKRGLFFTSAVDYGGARRKKLSRFLIEMDYKDQSSGTPESSGEILGKREKINLNNQKVKLEYLPEHFSFSQLAAFSKCPLQYKFNFILKVPIKGKSVFSFGKTMHNTLYEFLKQENENNYGQQASLFGFDKQSNKKSDGYENLNDIYLKNWIDEWFESKKQKEDYFKLGKRIVKDFYEKYSQNPPKILKIENKLALEFPFNLKIDNYKIYGVIDRMDEETDGVAIIDYKTGSPKEKLDADDKQQLLIYQIAAEEVLNIRPKHLVYNYLENNSKVSFLGSEKDKEQLKEKIRKEIDDIINSKFDPTPGWQCNFCDFKDICDSAEK